LERFNPEKIANRNPNWKRLRLNFMLPEKVPFLVLATLVAGVTYIALQNTGGMRFVETTFDVRLTNALSAYVKYIGKMFYPANPTVLYPYPNTASWVKLIAAAGMLTIISGIVTRYVRSFPYMFVGWFWYLGMLVPVIGVIDAGPQAMADRFVYVPFIGLYIVIAWGARKFLYEEGLAEQGRTAEATQHYHKALEIKPQFIEAINNLGLALFKQGQLEAVPKIFEGIVSIDSGYVDAHYNLGIVYEKQGRLARAGLHYGKALQIDPDHQKVRSGRRRIKDTKNLKSRQSPTG
jgi:tetratricopeptide (TPR) repeat protein